MPVYDFRCKDCGKEFTVQYRSYKDYEAATIICPECRSESLARVINRVHVSSRSRDYTRMDANEMLSVLESGDSRRVGEMFQQVGGSVPSDAVEYHETTQRLLDGESLESVEKNLQEKDAASQKKGTDSPQTP